MSDDDKKIAKPIERRKFLSGAALAGAAAAGVTASALPAPAYAQGKRKLKLVTTWPKNFPGLGFMAERAAKWIGEATDGRISIRVYAAGELVPALECFDAVSNGTADMYHGAEYYWQGKSKGFNFFTAVPFGLTAVENNAWVQFGGGQELWDELSAKFNVKGFQCGNTGVQMGGWFKKPVLTLDDWKGLKIRMPGLGGEVVRRMGAAATTIPGGEIFPALQSGAIDATEWVGPWNDLAFGFHKVVKYYAWPGFHEPGSTLALGINLDVWNSFDAADQALIRAVCLAVDNYSLAEYSMMNGRALKELTTKHGVEMFRIPNDVLAKIGEISGDVLREAAEEDELVKRIYESFIAARSEISEWSRISEQAFWEARAQPYKF